jgi:hypothetical protein
VVNVTSGSFEKEIQASTSLCIAQNAADLETHSIFVSALRECSEDIPHTKNNWLCYDFKERRIIPTHYTSRTNAGLQQYTHLKSWLVETSADEKSSREVAREKNNKQLKTTYFTGTFLVAGGVSLHPAGGHRQKSLRK